MTATYDLLPDLARLADDGCPHHVSADASATHPALGAVTARSVGSRPSLIARLLSRIWS